MTRVFTTGPLKPTYKIVLRYYCEGIRYILMNFILINNDTRIEPKYIEFCKRVYRKIVDTKF